MVKVVIITRILPKWRIEMFEEISRCAKDKKLKIEFIFDKGAKVIGEHYSSNYTGELDFKEFKIQKKIRFEYFSGLLKYLKKTYPDSIVVESSLNFMSTYIAIFYKVLSRKEVRIYGWSSGYFRKHSFFLNLFRKLIYKRFDGFFLYHTTAKKIFLEKMGIANTTVIGNSPGNKSINENIQFVLKSGMDQDVKKQYPEYKYIALFVGKLTESKRVEILLNTADDLSKLDTCILIIGDGPAKKKLEKNHYKNVFFLGNIEEDVNKYFQAADFFIMPGTGGMALIQAAYNNLPIITGLADGIGADIVEDGYNGFIKKDINSDFIVSMVKKILDRNLKNKLSSNMKIIAQKFKTEEIAKKMIGSIIDDFEKTKN